MAKQPTTSIDLQRCHIDPTTTATPVTSSGAKTLLPTPHQRRSCHISSYHNVIQAPTLRSRHRDGYCALAIPRPLMMTPNVVSAPRPSILVIMWSWGLVAVLPALPVFSSMHIPTVVNPSSVAALVWILMLWKQCMRRRSSPEWHQLASLNSQTCIWRGRCAVFTKSSSFCWRKKEKADVEGIDPVAQHTTQARSISNIVNSISIISSSSLESHSLQYATAETTVLPTVATKMMMFNRGQKL